jgi:hypothetical protein
MSGFIVGVVGVLIGIILLVAVAVPITKSVVTTANLSGTDSTLANIFVTLVWCLSLVLQSWALVRGKCCKQFTPPYMTAAHVFGRGFFFLFSLFFGVHMFESIFIVTILLLPFILLYLGYQYKNPYIILLAGVGILLIAMFFWTKSIVFEDYSQVCETVVANSTTIDNTTVAYTYTNFCYDVTNSKIGFNQTIFGTFFVILSLYVIYQGVLATVARK